MFTPSVPDACEVSVTGTSANPFSEVADSEVLDNGYCSAATFLLRSGTDGAGGCSTLCLLSRFFLFLGCCSFGTFFFVNSCHSSSCGYNVNLTQQMKDNMNINYILNLIRG